MIILPKASKKPRYTTPSAKKTLPSSCLRSFEPVLFSLARQLNRCQRPKRYKILEPQCFDAQIEVRNDYF
jgi:hypothetical protein